MKRIHQYKRQMLAAMRIAREYFAIVEDGYTPPCARTYIFAGKAAPGYWAAKQIIGLINHIGRVVNNDPRANQWMKVVFLPNYRVSLAEKIFPAAELSEQISTAGFEASGTGNMKFMLNGALTMGTLDGANVEMREEAGADNFFIFGLSTEEVAMARFSGMSAQELLAQQPESQRFFEAVRGDRFMPGHHGVFGWAYDMLVENFAPYFHLADIESYCKVQTEAGKLYANTRGWNEKAILNVARAGKFSSDRTIRQYASEIWKAL
jgi:starch phosphorylase